MRRLKNEVPPEFLNGIVDIAVSSKTVPHPVRADVYTLGECIPLEWSGSGADLASRVVLYHGSFVALAHQSEGEFEWREEAWDTLTHELRHHLEWRANVGALEAFDWAAEHNFARHEGDPFDPAFYRSGERVAPGIYKVDDDVFMEMKAPRGGRVLDVAWHGRRYQADLPVDFKAPAFLILEDLDEPPPGDAVVVLPRRPSLWALFSKAPAVFVARLVVRPRRG